MSNQTLKNRIWGSNLTNKILIPIFGFILILIATIIIIAFSATKSNLKSYFQEAITSKSQFMMDEVEVIKKSTLNNLDWFENSARMSKALLEKNVTSINDLGITAMKSFDIDYFLVTDTSGVVISCAHDKTENGINMRDNYLILQALQGVKISGVETTKKIPIIIQASSPLRNEKGKIIGAILIGHSLVNENFVDKIKKETGNEATIFFGSQRVMTTIKDVSNQRIVGTKLGNPEIEKKVLEENTPYYGESTIKGSKYKAAYLPLVSSNNKVVGMLFLGEKIDIISSLASQIGIYISIVAIVMCILILVLLRIILARTILKPIKLLVKNAEKIANGEIDITYVPSNTKEIKTLSNAFEMVSKKLNLLIDDISLLSNAAIEGNYEKRADISKHNGSYAKAIDGINLTLDSILNPLNELIKDVNLLSDSAIKGNLEVRADASKHKNIEFKKVINGFNNTLDAVIIPLNISANYIDRISKGDIPEKITEDYNGDFNILKNNLNQCIDAIESMKSDVRTMCVASYEGLLSTRVDASKHKGSYFKIVKGMDDVIENLSTPMMKAGDYVERISKGDMPPLITDEYRGEFNKIKNNLNSLTNAFNDIIEKSKLVAAGDLAVEFKKRSENDELIESLIGMINSFSSIVNQVQIATENIAGATIEMSSNSQQVSQGASEQAASAEEVSASMEEMAANIQQNTDNAQQTEKIAVKAAEDIIVSSKNVNETVNSMKQIADKVSIIGDIAFQTNILALNAAVEAARAGEHGRGFAVVAAEVRKLAEKSQIAAAEINALSKSSVQIAEESGKLLESIVPDIQKTARLVQEISAASIEQNSGAEQINNAINQLNQVTQQNAAAAEEMATSTEELSSQSDQLKDMIAFFKVNQQESSILNNAQKNKKQKTSNHLLDKTFKNLKKNGTILNMHDDYKDNDFEKF